MSSKRQHGRNVSEDGEKQTGRPKKRVRLTQSETKFCSVAGCDWNSSDSWALSRHVAAHEEKISRLREARRKREEMRAARGNLPSGACRRPLHRHLMQPEASGGATNMRDVVLHTENLDISHQDVPVPDPTPPAEDGNEDDDERGNVAVCVQGAGPNDLVEAAKQLVMEMAPKVGRAQLDRLLQVVLHSNWSSSAATMRAAGTLSVKDIFADSKKTLAQEIQENGFFRATIQSPRSGNPECCLEMFMRSPVQVIKNQLRQASKVRKNIFFDPVDERNRFNERVYGHPMSGKAIWETSRAIKEEIMSSSDLSTMWAHGESFVAYLQLYSDVSCMSLKTSAFSFYPLHISVLNFVPSEREDTIRRGETVVAYLPTAKLWPTAEQTQVRRERKFTADGEPLTSYPEHQNHQANRQSSTAGGTGRCGPRQSHEILSESLRICLEELREVSKKGISFEDADGNLRRAHLAIGSYVADTPEVICVTCLIGGHCPRCKISKVEMWTPGLVRETRTAADTEKAISEYNSSIEVASKSTRRASQRFAVAEAENNMKVQGLTSLLPATFDWPFSRVHPALDPYRIMRIDVMHTFPLGLQKEVLNLASKRLKSETLLTSVLMTQTGQMKPFKTVRRTILSHLNRYLRRIEEEAPSIGLHVDFSRGKAASATDGLFADNGIASMLEAKDLKSIAQVMPFLGALMDRLCGPERNGNPVTSVFVTYVKLEQALMRRGMDEKGFTQDALSLLQEKVAAFKRVTYEAFKDYQASGFNFPKWHAIEHAAEDIADLGHCSNYSADAFEYSHTVFKAFNRAGSQRKDTTLKETAEKVSAAEVRTRRLQGHEMLIGGRKRSEHTGASGTDQQPPELHDGADAAMVQYLTTGKKPEPKTRGLGHEATVSDACTLASTRSKNLSLNFGEIAAAIEKISTESGTVDWSTTGSSHSGRGEVSSLPAAKQFIAAVGGYALAKKVLDIFASKFGDVGTTGLVRRTMHIVKSARVAGFRCPTLDDVVDGPSNESNTAEIFLEDTGHRFGQKIVSALSYSGRSKPLQDTVLIEGDEPLLENGRGPPRRHMWVAKVLLFLHVSNDTRNISGIFDESYDRDEVGDTDDREVAVVRYYQVTPRRDLDSVDAALGCIKLTWAMDAEHEEPWVDVVPASSIRGRIHVVPVFDVEGHDSLRGGSKGLGSTVPDSSDSEGHSDDEGEAVFSGSRSWKIRQFYINHFRVDSRDIPYHVVDR